jgi:hypothetical protein
MVLVLGRIVAAREEFGVGNVGEAEAILSDLEHDLNGNHRWGCDE